MKAIFNLPGIRPDNESYYFGFIEGVTDFWDRDAEVEVNPVSEGISIAIRPSIPEIRRYLINDILSIHRMLGIKVDFSKSTNIQKSIVFKIALP